MSPSLLCYINGRTTNLFSYIHSYTCCTSDGINSWIWGRNFISITEYWDSYKVLRERGLKHFYKWPIKLWRRLINIALYHTSSFRHECEHLYLCEISVNVHIQFAIVCGRIGENGHVLFCVHICEASLQCFGLPEVDEELKDFQ